MKILYNDEDYMQDCIRIVFSTKYGIDAQTVHYFAEFQGQGDEFFQCTYAEQDNDLCPKEGKVAYLCWKMDGSDEIDTAAQNRAKEKAEGSLELRPIDKAKFAQLIYSDNEALRKVNAIVHPAVWNYVRERIREHENEVGEGRAFAAVESALPDAEFEDICDKTWYIYADDETRIERLMKSRGYSKEKCISIIKSQRSADEFKKLADHVIDNSGSEEETAGQIEELLK